MTAEHWVVWGAAIIAISGVPGLLLGRHTSIGQRLAVLLMFTGAGCVLSGIVHDLQGGPSNEMAFASPLIGNSFTLAMDSISVVFLLPILSVSLWGSVYGLGYWPQAEHPDNGRKLSLFYGLLAASLIVLVLARDGAMFLFAWEIMALSAFFAVTTEDDNEEVMRAGWLYLAASHVATLCLFAMFALMWCLNGTFAFVPMSNASTSLATAIFVLALLGFGTKAGIMPLHIWLPPAHAAAPSHVSALLSGVVIKMGIYGLVRIGSLFPNPPVWWGAVLLALGVISGVIGIAFALGQQDLKRMLAYSSVENIGIICLGLGLALVGQSQGVMEWVALGLGGALLHVWNHALFKSLLFFCAGSVVHATHTRQINLLGGLSKVMPRTSLYFLIGAVAICGLPPLNGFVSELLIYLGLFRTLGIEQSLAWVTAAFAVPALGLIGGLAAACYTMGYGMVFLGAGRSEHVKHAHEAPWLMRFPMAMQALCCLAIGLTPMLVTPLLQSAISEWQPAVPAIVELVPLHWVSRMAIVLVGMLIVGVGVLAWRIRQQPVGSTVTWDCGYAAPTSRMQYTSSSFAQMLVHNFAWALRPKRELKSPEGLFPSRAEFKSEVPDSVLDRAIWPTFDMLTRLFAKFRVFQQGSMQMYLLYILVILVFLLMW